MGHFGTQRNKSLIKFSELQKKMNANLALVMFVGFAMVSTAKKDNVKVSDLAEELAKARLEINQMIQRENEKLKEENKMLRNKDEELEQRLRDLSKVDSELRQSIRQRDGEQRDQNYTSGFQNFYKNKSRQMDFDAELEKRIQKGIKAYLNANKMCVSGWFEKRLSTERVEEDYTINFGHTFQRIPTFVASIRGFEGSGKYLYVWEGDKLVTESSAVITLLNSDDHWRWMRISWIA